MLYRQNLQVGLCYKDIFIADAFLGENQLLGFSKEVSVRPSSQIDTDPRLITHNLGSYSLEKDGYIQFNFICSKLKFTIWGVDWLKRSASLLNIYFKDLGGNVLYKINITLSWQSSKNYGSTYLMTLYDSVGEKLKEATWDTYLDYSAEVMLFEYDFKSKKYRFGLIQNGNGMSGTATYHEIFKEYTPLTITIQNDFQGNSGYDFRAIATVQN